MSTQKWKVTFKVHRQKANNSPNYDEYKLEVDPEEYVLDAVERIWAFHDRSLTFAHACHHSTCGACGMRVNGVEKLTCITFIHEIAKNGSTIKIEPLRNFPVISDLVVDMSTLYSGMEMVGQRPIVPLSEEPATSDIKPVKAKDGDYIRLSDCIECGLCISACPVATTTSGYFGPAILAGARQASINGGAETLKLVDCADGVWRCHSAYECTEVCPSFVEPGKKIMQLRRAVLRSRIKSLFGSRN